jgi:arsenate reductase
MVDKPRVLFLCISNSARSQMAEAFLRFYAGDKYEAYSAGIESAEIHPLTRKVMSEIGFDLSGQYSKPLTEYMGKVFFSYLITVCGEADKKCPTTYPGMGERIRWSFDDPVAFQGTEEQKLAKFRETRDQIKQKVREWVDEQARNGD